VLVVALCLWDVAFVGATDRLGGFGRRGIATTKIVEDDGGDRTLLDRNVLLWLAA